MPQQDCDCQVCHHSGLTPPRSQYDKYKQNKAVGNTVRGRWSMLVLHTILA